MKEPKRPRHGKRTKHETGVGDQAMLNSRGEVVHLVVRSAEGAWLPFDEQIAVERADAGIARLIDSGSYA